MKYLCIAIVCCAALACKSGAKEQEEKKQDSVDQSQMEKVDQMVTNQDSLIKAEEKRLKEKYGN